MNTSIRILVAMLVCTAAAGAQTIRLESELAVANARKVKYAWTVTITGRTAGGLELSVDAGSVALTGNADDLGSLSAAAIFDAIAARSVALTYDADDAACTSGGSSVVTVASCVTRTADGFVATGDGLTRRIYIHNCSPLGSAALLGVIWDVPDCASAAEPTSSRRDAEIR
jgi:hypothetical protein